METFILKLLDSILTTLKSISLIKNKRLLSSSLAALSGFVYSLIMVDMQRAILISIATLIGSQISFFIAEQFEKDKVWVFHVTPTTSQAGKDFADMIRENNIPITTFISYKGVKDKVLSCIIYSQSKEHSQMVRHFIPEGFKYHVQETRSYVE